MNADVPTTDQVSRSSFSAPSPAAAGPPGADELRTWRPRPVHIGWWCALSALVAIVLGISIWLGALMPRFAVSSQSATSSRATLTRTFGLRNDAATTADLRGVTGHGEGVRLVHAVVVSPNQSRWLGSNGQPWPDHPMPTSDLIAGDDVRLSPGESVELYLVYEVSDCATAARGASRIDAQVRTVVGLTRAVSLDDGHDSLLDSLQQSVQRFCVRSGS